MGTLGTTLTSAIEIGWSSVDITPLKHPVAMRAGEFSSGVLDPITATALAIRENSESETIILVSCDLLWITDGNRVETNMRDEVRRRVIEQGVEIDPGRIILSATHTHVAPVVQREPAYFDFVCGRITEAVVDACRSLAPGGISFGLGHAVIGHNRIVSHEDGSARMVGSLQEGTVSHPDFSHIEGFEDHSVHLLYTFDREKNLTGIVVNVPCPAQVQRGDKISADFWHELREEVGKRFGPNIRLLPQVSAAGDLATIVMVESEAERRMSGLQFPELSGDPRAARRRQIADQILRSIVNVYEVVQNEIEMKPLIAHRGETLALSPGFPTPEPSAKKVSIELHAVRIGDVAIVTNPFELYLDYGIRIKGRSPATQTFVVELAGSGSYVPTRRAVAGGAYGAMEKSCVFGPEAGDAIVMETKSLLEKLWERR